MAKDLTEQVSNHRLMIGVTPGQYRFVGGVAKKLKVTRTEAMRQIVQFARKEDGFKGFVATEMLEAKAKKKSQS